MCRDDTQDDRRFGSGPRLFGSTHWSVIAAAGANDDPVRSANALESLCRRYWYPLYAYARRTGKSPEDAHDLTQSFFARLLLKQDLARVRPDRGRFRWFLIAAFRNFLANDWDRASARKRGGGQPLLSIDALVAEGRYGAEPADAESPDRIYDRTWALQLLEQARIRLHDEYAAKGWSERFDLLETFLPGEAGNLTCAEVGRRIGLTEGAVKCEIHRLKQRFREALREEVAHTVSTPLEVDEEIRHLISTLSS